MFSALPMYQRQGKSAFKKDLSNTIAFCDHLESPQYQFKSIHVGGTNGKGSCSHMLASILQATGLKVGLYTSPHLKDFRERIKINGELISENEVTEFIANHQGFIEELQPSFFEMTVAMAFDYFAKQKVDVAVIEVGLGGRLDSTNVIHPVLSLITNIGFDHVDMLGDTLPLIAAEKAGIIKAATPVVIGEHHPETAPVFEQKAKAIGAELIFAENTQTKTYPSDLKGTYQAKNQRAVLAAIAKLQEMGWSIEAHHIEKGLGDVMRFTGLKGRWQVLHQAPLTIADTGHNNEAFAYLIPQLKSLPHDQLWMVLGFVKEKQVTELLQGLPEEAHLVFTMPNVPRGMPLEELKAQVAKLQRTADFIEDVNEAIAFAQKQASDKDLIFIGGSTFVVAEINDL